jgi:hypothetical protein
MYKDNAALEGERWYGFERAHRCSWPRGSFLDGQGRVLGEYAAGPAHLTDPTATEAVKLALKEMSRPVPARQLVLKEIEIFLQFERRGRV